MAKKMICELRYLRWPFQLSVKGNDWISVMALKVFSVEYCAPLQRIRENHPEGLFYFCQVISSMSDRAYLDTLDNILTRQLEHPRLFVVRIYLLAMLELKAGLDYGRFSV